MSVYAIMQEPGARALGRRARLHRAGIVVDGLMAPPMRRVGTVEGEGEKDALAQYVFEKYLTTGNRQLAGYALEWASERSNRKRWHADDRDVKRGRTWRARIRLANGRTEHEVIVHAWEQS